MVQLLAPNREDVDAFNLAITQLRDQAWQGVQQRLPVRAGRGRGIEAFDDSTFARDIR